MLQFAETLLRVCEVVCIRQNTLYGFFTFHHKLLNRK